MLGEFLRYMAPAVLRESWPPGPWDNEPDLVEMEHAGFHGCVRRAWNGSLAGYIAVPPGHPWHGKHYRAVNAHVHGYLTFSAQVGSWWCLGFDCGHSRDLAPFDALVYSPRLLATKVYRDFGYVRKHVESLCEQAAKA